MAGGFGPELKRLLNASGCTFERPGKGDHEIWYSPITQRRSTVDHKILSRHTAKGVLKHAGLPKAFRSGRVPGLRRTFATAGA